MLIDDLTKETAHGVKMPLLRSGYYDLNYVQKVSGLVIDNQTPPYALKPDSIPLMRKLKTFLASDKKLSVLKQKIFSRDLQDPKKNGYAHKWMWDEMQLRCVLTDIGFTDICTHSHVTSGLDSFASFSLDSKTDGGQRHPLSLYIEATKH